MSSHRRSLFDSIREEKEYFSEAALSISAIAVQAGTNHIGAAYAICAPIANPSRFDPLSPSMVRAFRSSGRTTRAETITGPNLCRSSPARAVPNADTARYALMHRPGRRSKRLKKFAVRAIPPL